MNDTTSTIAVNELTRFERAAEQHLRPMLPGAILDGVHHGTKHVAEHASVGKGAVTIKVRARPPTRAYLLIRRSQRFFDADLDVARVFADEFTQVEQSGVASDAHRSVLLGEIPQRIAVRIAGTTAGLGPQAIQVLAAGVSMFREWASQTYEGQPIASGLGIDNDATGSGPLLDAYAAVPAAKVLGDGVASFYSFGANGRVASFQSLGESTDTGDDVFRYPFVFRRVSRWTADGHRVAVCLTRRGEILVFANGTLQFANRHGTWLHANHDGAMATWTKIHLKHVRRAVYATCLDASFSRSGACIAVLSQRSASQAIGETGIVRAPDLLSQLSGDAKRDMLHAAIQGQAFHDIPRDVRRQLVAVDGATVLSSAGTVLAAGAIVRVSGGSDGGGRLAATRALAPYGFAAKVSADGSITAFQGPDVQLIYRGL